jgi:hypothetical protein
MSKSAFGLLVDGGQILELVEIAARGHGSVVAYKFESPDGNGNAALSLRRIQGQDRAFPRT